LITFVALIKNRNYPELITKAMGKSEFSKFSNLISKIKSFLKILINQKLFPNHLVILSKKLFDNQIGLEIGGISKSSFSETGFLPIYPIVRRLDNCTYSTNTVWEGLLEEGFKYLYSSHKAMGYQYILEGTNLDKIPSEKYDFLLSSHVLEHIANPIMAMQEWLRVIKPNGYLVLILPNKEVTFDHRRPITKFCHFLEDFENNTTEEDLTHLSEILELHDLERDPAAGDFNSFKLRSERNFANRCLHHHVFDINLVEELLNYLDLNAILIEESTRLDILAIAQKVKPVNKTSI
jgi:SAM-dependent methyltransferase